MMNKLWYRDWMGKKKNGGLSESAADVAFDALVEEKPWMSDEGADHAVFKTQPCQCCHVRAFKLDSVVWS